MNLTLISYTQVSNNDSPETFKRLEPVSITDMQTHAGLPTLLIPPADDPLYIETLIQAAREEAEAEEGGNPIQLLTAVYEYSIDSFPGTVATVPSWLDDSTLRSRVIRLPRPPFQELLSVKYDDANGDEQTIYDSSSPLLDAGIVRVSGGGQQMPLRKAELHEISGQTWPTALVGPDVVRIRYRCGFGDTAASVPAAIRVWIMRIAAECYKERELTAPAAVATLNLDFLRYSWRVERSIV